MRKIKQRFKKSILISLAIILGLGIFSKQTFSATTQLSGDYSGATDKTITVDQAGIYSFNLYGAQGGSYGSYTGGKGGQVTFSALLNKNDTVKIVTGAGAGTGKLTNGGGYSAIYINGTLAGVAGGGGGAVKGANGYDGGATGSGNNNTSLTGSSSTTTDSAGGGGGYQGGTSGTGHTHMDANGIYHEGNFCQASNPGGCYGAAGHTHDAVGSCSTQKYTAYFLDDHDYGDGCDWHQGGNENGYVYRYKCGGCGQVWRYGNPSGDHSKVDPPVHYHYNCGSPTNTWKLTCTKTVSSTPSKGGSNYINTSKALPDYPKVDKGGVNAGVAKVSIQKITRYIFDYNTNNTSALEHADVEYRDAVWNPDASSYEVPTLPAPSLDGSSFMGWTSDSAGSQYINMGNVCDNSKAEITLYTKWNAAQFKIKLIDLRDAITEDGTNVLSVIDNSGNRNYFMYAYTGAAYSSLPNLSLPGYTFNGWYTQESGGIKVKSTDICNLNYNLSLTYRSDPSIKDTLLDGSNTEDINEDFYSTQLYAQWIPKTYTVTFNSNGGTLSGSSSKTVTYDSEYGTMPTASKSGSRFIGWSTDANDKSKLVDAKSLVKIASNHILYAMFTEIKGTELGYTGEWQTYTIPENGYYKLEVYGAQGGNYDSYIGGKGGYAQGIKYFDAGTVLKVNVGGGGPTGGYGGGGTGSASYGGGATDVRVNDSTIIIAGGGGGANAGGNGGHGGLDEGMTTTKYSGQSNTEDGGAGGGGGYYGGKYGEYYYYVTTERYTYTYKCSGCIYTGRYYHSYPCPYHDYDHNGTSCDGFDGYDCNGHSAVGTRQVTKKAYRAATGGSNYISPNMYYHYEQAGVQIGNGLFRITPLYELILDTNRPTTTVADVNATNTPTIIDKNAVNQLDGYRTPVVYPTVTSGSTYSFLVESGKKLSYLEFLSEMPQPKLKGWTFMGWYSQSEYKTVGTEKKHSGRLITIDTVYNPNELGHTKLMGNKIYAHWDENVYYIRYVRNDTTQNVYGDACTSLASYGPNMKDISSAKYTKGSIYYTQTCLYDHDVEVLHNLYAKTGYYFSGWTNKADTTVINDSNTKGTGTGKKTGTLYNECEILKPVANGETFQAGKCNFTYITDAKTHEDSTSVPKWSYTQSGVANGSNVIIMYATWEPIKYNLRFNGTDNWNDSSSFTLGSHTGEDSYLQKVTNASGNQDTKIRYDQIFTLDANLFKREAPHTIQSEDGLSVVLKTGYGHLGWGFGQDTMKYSASPSYKLISMNTKADNEQALTSDDDTTGRNYEEKQANVKNVISAVGIQKITKYISDWSNARTTSNIKDKSELENNVIESNLHSLWRRNSNDNHINEDVTGCPCPDDGNGNCICPSDSCPDRDGDGTCDNHDPNPDDPTIPSKCPCGTDSNGNCICPSDNCPDNDNDGVCDNHDPNPNDPTIPNDGHDHGNSCPCGPDGSGNCKCPSSNCPDKDGDGICDNHDPDPNNPNIPNPNGDDNDDCPCGSDGNGNCICPSDTCPDRDGDGICDNHDPDPDNPNIPSRCPCGTNSNGNCICPSDGCPDKDGDGVCDNHDPDPNNPYIPNVNKCPCGTDSNGNCICPSDNCPDNDKDGVCDNHDPDPNNPNIPNNQGSGSGDGDNNTGDPTNPNDSNFGITLTFDLNGGYINKNNRFYYSPIVLKQELFNDYFYEFDIIGNVNKDHLNHTAIADIYGAYSNTNTPKKNYNAYTGLNVIYNKGDGNGGLYRLSGWSTNKGAIYPDYKVTIDGIKNNNFDTFDAANNNNTIKICNDTTLYAVWEPVLQMNVELTNTVTGNKVKTGTLTDATQENMQRNGLPTLAVKPGQEIKYLIALRGENKATVGSRIEPMNLTVEFDSMMTGIYNSQYKDLHDGLNQIAADDLDDPNEKMILSTTNLNRKFVKQPNKSIIRKFSIPVYLGTERAEEVGYPSFKSDGYTLNITLSRPSNFHKGDEVVTAKLILDTTGAISGSSGSGGSGGSGGTSGGGGTGSNLPSSTVGEFRTNIR